MSIKIGSKIEKLNPGDQYKLMDGGDVEGFELTLKPVTIVNGKLVGTRSDDSQVDIGSLDDYSELKNGQVPIMGPDGKLIYSGVTVTDSGLVRIPEGTLGFGEPLTLGAAVGFAILHNNVTELSYVLIDASLSDKTGSGRPTQFYVDTPSVRPTGQVGGGDITDNPATFTQTTTQTGATFSITLDAAAPMKNVKIQIIDAVTKVPFKHVPSRRVWDDPTIPGMDFRAGKNTLNFFSNEPDDPANGVFNIGVGPITLAKDWKVDYIIKADNVNLKGDTNGLPMLETLFGLARFRGLAYEDELKPPQAASGVVSVGLDGTGKLVVTHADGSKNLITLPSSPGTALAARVATVEQTMSSLGVDVAKIKQDYGRVDLSIKTLEGVYTYDGDSAPTLPADPKAAYFLNFHGTTARDIAVPTPLPSSGPNINGAVIHSVNANDAANVAFTASAGFTINGMPNYAQTPETFTLMVLDGTDWKVVESTSLTAQATPLTADNIANAIDHGTAPNSGSIKSLDEGWWFVPSANDKTTGRPKGATGDVTIFRQNLSEGNKTKYAVVLAFGNDADNKPSMWAEYRNGTSWTSWFKVNQSADLSALTSDIAALKSGDAGQLARLTRLETDIGRLYAPTKVSFDKSVNALIDAKIKAKQGDLPSLPSGIPKIYGNYGVNVPTSLSLPGQVTSVSGLVTLRRVTTSQERIFITVPNDTNQAEDVTGFSVDGSLTALWSARELTFDGKKYKTFYSPGAYTEKVNNVRVYFGNQAP